MCARRSMAMALIVLAMPLLAACASPERSASSFCAQAGKELPGLGASMVTQSEVSAMVKRYERLAERAPLSIEDDLRVFTDVLRQAAKVNIRDPDAVQALTDATYAAAKSALNVRDWVKSTCAIDISKGMMIEPPRRPAATTTSTSTSTSTP